ncbi:MAG: (2Fe-2S)-binding protein [Acidimicrobiales bacterium]
MVICHCRAVNDQSIRATILAGARTTDDVGRRCGAGVRCGGCLPALLGLLAELDRHGDTRTSAA